LIKTDKITDSRTKFFPVKLYFNIWFICMTTLPAFLFLIFIQLICRPIIFINPFFSLNLPVVHDSLINSENHMLTGPFFASMIKSDMLFQGITHATEKSRKNHHNLAAGYSGACESTSERIRQAIMSAPKTGQ